MPSFDVVSKLPWDEVSNALNQAKKEISQRFDFKASNATLEQTEKGIAFEASTDDRVKAAYEVLQEKLARRKVSLKHFEAGDITPGPRGTAKMLVSVTEGISTEKAKEIIKLIKTLKLKVQGAIQEDTVRITGKKRDDLQGAIAELKKADLGVDLQFINFRE
ncbi:MAG TPA: YajQ family cyclic di-GMP-binding protein [Polyangiaceae bacterium]|nr:YajQ family cyclic di-GMP-binding protein [Polyangiaceae bacterium]